MDGPYDVVVVGAGPAGCAAATLLGRQGLRVALLEAHRNPAHYKRLCTHYLQASALPALQRLGADTLIEAAGGVRNGAAMWSRYGWVHEPDDPRRPAYGYNIHRSLLDPLLRRMAADVPSVDLVLGATVRSLTRDQHGRTTGVTVRMDGQERRLTARLVVGADGKSSAVAEQAGLPARQWANSRFYYFATYRGVGLSAGPGSRVWFGPTAAAYAFGNDNDTVVLGLTPDKRRLAEFQGTDKARVLEAAFVGLPDGPDLSRAERLSDVVGALDYPSITRRRVVAPGVGLVGDAALVGDPLWGVGCGWALQSAQWLADAAGEALLAGDDQRLDRALRRYQRRHRLRLLPHQLLAVDFSRGRAFNPLERLVFSAATTDDEVAAAFWRFGTRSSSPAALVAPRILARAAVSRTRQLAGAPAVPRQRAAASRTTPAQDVVDAR